MTSLKHLAELARAATPGPWRVSDGRYDSGDVVQANPSSAIGGGVVRSSSGPGDSGGCDPDDAAYIAAASPDVVEKLIRVAERAQDLLVASSNPSMFPMITMEAAQIAENLREAIAALEK